MNFSGQIWKYGDDINTDVIFPGKYTYTLRDPKEMSKHALEDLDPEFASSVQTVSYTHLTLPTILLV